ncbi:NB-ARC domain-containing protein [Streptosporangium soli]|nr:NB-ARC domain-containing protein [Streptosporangium sp. KLBMP 9127]
MRLRRGNLPAETSSFVGRTREIDEVATLVAGSALVTLTGVAGVGKTRLAIKVAEQAAPSFPEGVWVAELSAEQNPDLVAHNVAASLGMLEQSVRPQEEVLTEFLAGKRMLLILDTCEHLLASCTALVRRVLERAPGVHVLATSRQPLRDPAEQLFRVDPLPVPEPGVAAPGDYCAVRLFLARARALVPGLDPDREAVARLCRLLDGIPLAIELAARRVRSLSVEQIGDRLDDRFALLAGGNRSPLRRHQTLRTAIGWSHELCTAEERLLWARLTVFAGSFDVTTAQAVCGDDRLLDVRGALDRLVDKSIVIVKGDRYQMLDMVREYGAEWLNRLDDHNRLARRHREHYLFLAQRADEEWYGPAQEEWADWVRRELPNLRVALDGSLNDPGGLELAGALWFAWFCLGQIREGRYYLDRVLSAQPKPGPARTKALWAAGWVSHAQGDLAAAERRADEALAETVGRDDPAAAGYATYTSCALHLLHGDVDRADKLLTQAIAHFQEARQPEVGLPIAEAARALLHNMRGEFDQASAVLSVQRARCVQRGDVWARSYGDHMRSLAELGRGEIGAAEAYARAALDVKWRLGDAMGSAMALDQLAATAVARRKAERAAYLLGAAQRLWATIGIPWFGSPELAAPRTATEARARELLGDAAYEAAFSFGLTIEPELAVARIRDGG